MNGCVVLAAGASRRLGRPKQLLDLGGRPLLSWILDAARAFAPTHTVLVLGHEASAIRSALDLRDLSVVINDRYPDGMSTSLKAGVAALSDTVDCVALCTGDQPFVTVDHLRALRAALEQTPNPIIATKYDDHAGVPLLMARDAWPLILGLTGDGGARSLLRKHAERITFVRAKTDVMKLDVDTWEAYADVRAALHATNS